MPGFVASHFVFMEKHLLREVRSVENFSELPSLILCHAPIEITFLKQFFANHQLATNNFYFHTFDEFVFEISNKFLPGCHAVNGSDLKFLAQNKQIHWESRILSQFFSEENFTNRHKISADIFAALPLLEQQIQALNWQSPQRVLKKITANAPKLFTKCILFGFSSQDYWRISFFKLLQKIAYHVTFFAFDRGDHIAFKLLEHFFGSAENVNEEIFGSFSQPQVHFTTVDDPVDAAAYSQQLISSRKTQGNVAIICQSQPFATLVAHNLEVAQIPFHNAFPVPLLSSRDNFVFAWHQWQTKNNWESFMDFCNFLQYFEPNLLPQNIDIGKFLTKTFDDYPAIRVQDLTDFSEDFGLKNILKRYPVLAEKDSFREFSKKTSPVIPEIVKYEKYFPDDFQATKEAFLDYAFNLHFTPKLSHDKSHSASIFLLDLPSVMHLQFDEIIILFQNNSTPFPFTSLQVENVHCIALKCDITREFVTYHQRHTGKFLDADAIQSLHFSPKENTQDHHSLYDFLKKIHQIRNDKNSNFGIFEYVTPEIQSYSPPITAIERAYSEPEEIWYRHILKNDRPKLSFEKSKFEGILTHNLLHWPDHSLPAFEQFQRHVALKKQFFLRKFANILSQTRLQETIESAEEKASIIAKKLTAIETFPFIISEIDLHTPIVLSDGNSIPLHGRIDCILSLYPFRKTLHRDNAQNSILLVDFKTGIASQSDLRKLVKDFTNLPQSLADLQLVLYGLMLRSIGYQNIQLLILNGDPYDHGEPISLEMITAGKNFEFIQKYLKTLLIDGIFGYGESHPFSKTHFHPPIATLQLDTKVIQSKRQQLFPLIDNHPHG
jgi:hypothetical protein